MRRQLKRISGKDTGLTLVELAVAVLVLSIASVAAIRAMDQSRVAIGGAQDRALAQLVARNRAEELRAFGAQGALPSSVVMGPQTFRVETSTSTTAAGLIAATVTARSQNGAGALYVVYLPAGVGQ